MSQNKRINFGEIALIALMTWVFFVQNLKYLNFNATELLRWLFPALMIISAFLTKQEYLSFPKVLVFYIIAITPSLLFSIDSSLSVQKFLSFVLVFWGSYSYFNSKNFDSFDYCFSAFSAVVTIIQILNVVFIIANMGKNARSSGLTTNPNTLGIYSNLAFWCGVFFFKKSKNIVVKSFFVFVILSAIYSAVASASRSTFVIILTNILILVYYTFRKSSLLFLFGGVSVLTVFLLFSGKLSFLNISVLDRFAEEGTSRDALWEDGINAWRDSPLFGCGYMTSNQINPEQGLQFHNSYLSFLIDCGIWGAFWMLSGIISIMTQVIKNFRVCSDNKTINMFLIVVFMLLDLALSAWGESFMFAVGSTEGFSFWFLLAFTITYIKKKGV